ncbi:NSE1-like protein [Mya arenaria]|uniref:Non-structural maintenance of chromosomes element 1 homolog n=1 Tax=Mya arenaria TaxID=6604 RepID=A0ABY7FR22_MYAAR|nr:NSE1-like protein [Mya arenaria]
MAKRHLFLVFLVFVCVSGLDASPVRRHVMARRQFSGKRQALSYVVGRGCMYMAHYVRDNYYDYAVKLRHQAVSSNVAMTTTTSAIRPSPTTCASASTDLSEKFPGRILGIRGLGSKRLAQQQGQLVLHLTQMLPVSLLFIIITKVLISIRVPEKSEQTAPTISIWSLMAEGRTWACMDVGARNPASLRARRTSSGTWRPFHLSIPYYDKEAFSDEEKTQLLLDFCHLINSNISMFGMEIKKACDEMNGKSFYGLVNTTETSVALLSSQYTENELDFVKKLIEEFVKSDRGSIGSIAAMDITDSLPKKMSKTEAGRVYLGIRGLMEMEQYILEMYEEDAVRCNVCKKLCLQGEKCDCCTTKIHNHCSKSS